MQRVVYVLGIKIKNNYDRAYPTFVPLLPQKSPLNSPHFTPKSHYPTTPSRLNGNPAGHTLDTQGQKQTKIVKPQKNKILIMVSHTRT